MGSEKCFNAKILFWLGTIGKSIEFRPSLISGVPTPNSKVTLKFRGNPNFGGTPLGNVQVLRYHFLRLSRPPPPPSSLRDEVTTPKKQRSLQCPNHFRDFLNNFATVEVLLDSRDHDFYVKAWFRIRVLAYRFASLLRLLLLHAETVLRDPFARSR